MCAKCDLTQSNDFLTHLCAYLPAGLFYSIGRFEELSYGIKIMPRSNFSRYSRTSPYSIASYHFCVLPLNTRHPRSEFTVHFSNKSDTAVLLSIFGWCHFQNIPKSSRKLTLVFVSHPICNLCYGVLCLS